MTTADGSRPAADDETRYDAEDVDQWQQQVVWWDRTFVAIVVLTAAALPLSGESGRALWVALAAMGVVLVAYAAWGAPAARSRDQGRAVAYVVVLIAGTAVTVAQNGIATLLLFGAFSQLWMLLEPPRRAVVASVVLAAATSFGIAFQEGFDLPTLLEAAPQMAIALAFAIMLGLWVATTMRRSDERARLLCELRDAQAEVAASHHSAGVAAERERIAREIHDTLAQGFTSVVTQAQAAASDLDRGQEDRARERLHLVEQTARDNLAEARGLVAAFAPVPLQGSTLGEALRRLADRFTAETGVAVHLDVSGAGAVGAPRDAAADVVVLRAAQEALANVRRHAEARIVTIRLEPGDRADGSAAIRLEVTDDGRGLPSDHTEGLGLAGMRERVTAAGGRLDVGPAGDRGTRVAVSLPLEETS